VREKVKRDLTQGRRDKEARGKVTRTLDTICVIIYDGFAMANPYSFREYMRVVIHKRLQANCKGTSMDRLNYRETHDTA